MAPIVMAMRHDTRRTILRALIACTLPVSAARAAPPNGVKRLGVLLEAGKRGDDQQMQMRTSLGELGYVEGKNLLIEWRFTADDLAQNEKIAAELVGSGVDALATGGTFRTRALQQATATIPIVTMVGDALASGFAKSIRRPGGNITGLSYKSLDPQLDKKMIGFLRAFVPRLGKLAIVASEETQSHPETFASLVAAAKEARIECKMAYVRDVAGYDAVFRSLQSPTKGAAFVVAVMSDTEARNVALSAIHFRVATMCNVERMVEAGFLLSYTLSGEGSERRFATVLDKVLNGANPGEIPFELPTKFRLAINRNTAASLKLTTPPDMLLAADRVVE